MTLVDIHLLNAMRAERDAALAENARLRAAVGDWGNDYFGCIAWPPGSCGHTHHDPDGLTLTRALAAPTADDGAERGAR